MQVINHINHSLVSQKLVDIPINLVQAASRFNTWLALCGFSLLWLRTGAWYYVPTDCPELQTGRYNDTDPLSLRRELAYAAPYVFVAHRYAASL